MVKFFPAPRLVHKDPSTGQLVLNQDTLRALRHIPGPVAVVGICGGARKGKSSLLNRIMECQGGGTQSFETSADVDPCTKGLHTTTVPVPAKDKSGSPYSLLFLDMEGVEATDHDRRDMAQMLILCTLLSSVVLLNELACISEATMDTLSAASAIRGIFQLEKPTDAQQGAAGDQGTLEALGALTSFSPTFFLVLRDFALRLKGGMDPSEYLEQALEDLPEEGARAAAAAEKNRVRRGIRTLFPVRRCVTLVRPTLEEEKLQESHQQSLADLRPQFQAEVKQLAKAVCATALPPMVHGVTLTGPLLASLCEAYVSAMNGGAVVHLGSVHVAALGAACASVTDKASRLYVKTLGEYKKGNVDSLNDLHTRGLSAALRYFKTGTKDFPEGVVTTAEWKLRWKTHEEYNRAFVAFASMCFPGFAANLTGLVKI